MSAGWEQYTRGFSLPLVPLWAWGVLTILGTTLLGLLPSRIRRTLWAAGRLETNFRGDRILQSYGLLIGVWAGMMLVGAMFLLPSAPNPSVIWLLVVAQFTWLGWQDDDGGDRAVKGLRGHFRAAIRDGEYTTGFIKAVGGLIIGCLVSLFLLHLRPAGSRPEAWAQVGIHTLLIALAANALNLLDLRPGRAVGVFLALSLLLVGGFWWAGGRGFPFLLFVAVPAGSVWRLDSRAQAMLGDTGSNLLGASLGLALAALPLSLWAKGGVVLLLIGLHLVAERYSLTRIIAANPVLRWLDGLTGVR